MSEIYRPGPDGNAGDLWNERPNRDDDGQDGARPTMKQ